MDDAVQSVLLTLAELSIAYVGFAAIVGALSSKSQEWDTGTKVLFRSMIDIGLVNVFLCLIPNFLFLLAMDGTALWTISSSIAAVLVSGVFIARMVQIRRTLGTPLRIGRLVLIPLIVVTISAYLTNAVVYAEAGLYVLATGVHILVCTVQFLAVIYTLFPIETSK